MAQKIGYGLKPSKTRLGEFIRNRRFKLGLSQNRLAELTETSQSNISAWETGKNQGKKSGEKGIPKKLAEALECEPARLEKLLPKKPADKPATGLGKLIKSRLQALGLTPDDLTEILKVSKSCVNNWLTGRSLSISYELFKPLAAALKLKPADLGEFALKRNKPARIGFGQMIRQRRQERGWSGPVLADKVGSSRAGISLIERQGICSDKLAEKLAKELGLNPAILLALKPEKKKLGRPKKINR